MTGTNNQTRDVHAFWNEHAKLGRAAGTRDLIVKQLEIKAILKYVSDGMRVLDAGCGNGTTAIKLASRYNVHIVAFDFAEKMIEAATASAADAKLKGSVNFLVADIRNIPEMLGKFDLIYTERVLINLPDWPAQKRAITDITNTLEDDGVYVMCENSQDGLHKINLLREQLDLPRIEPPWHNRYLEDSEIKGCTIPGIKLERIEYFTSTYYLLSRVVNAKLAAEEGKEPDYDAPVNQLALHLPPIGDLGQTRMWIWRKMASGDYATKTDQR